MGAWGWLGCDDCCSVPPEYCNHCVDDEMPFCLELVITDAAMLAVHTCRACDCINGLTINLAYYAACDWRGETEADCDCIHTAWRVVLSKNVSDHYILTVTGGAEFVADLGTNKPNCMTWSNIEAAFSRDLTSACDYSGATATISAKTTGSCPSPQPTDPATVEQLLGSYYCQTCGSNYPAGVYVKLEDLTANPGYEDPCANCDLLNATYYLPRDPDPDDCHLFRYEFPQMICDVESIYVTFEAYPSGGNRTLVVAVRFELTGGISCFIMQSAEGIMPAPCTGSPVISATQQGNCGGIGVSGHCGYWGGDKGQATLWW
ncbi:MAG: hypothetical protein ACYSWU_29050 [Planctomycetota bacterium]|jgi:hypothetical protein